MTTGHHDTAAPEPREYDAEADCWGSWWLAHHLIGEDVKSGRRELPPLFRSMREREAGR